MRLTCRARSTSLLGLACALALTACRADPSAFELRFADGALRARAATVEVTISEGTCSSPGPVVYGPEVFAVDAEGMRPAALPRTPHAFRARALDASCTVFAETCVDVDLGAQGSAPVILTLTAGAEQLACEATSCRAGVCEAALDAGGGADPDAGVTDAMGIDAFGLDGGPPDAALLDAVTSDAVTLDVGTDAGHVCAGAGVFFCEDFEDPTLPQWTPVGAGGVLLSAMGEVRAGADGARALFASAGAGEQRVLRTTVAIPVPAGPIYVRFWERFGGAVATETNHKLFYLELGEPDAAPRYFFGASNSATRGDGVFLAYTDGTTTSSTGVDQALPPSTWVCVSMTLPLGGENTFVLDGSSEHGPPDPLLARSAASTAQVVVGIDNRMGEAMSAYLDDLEIGSMPLPCP
ncbi:MAG: hypothetical protein K1X94_26770 [Sandaracinaceae bacterium]|nr:hypothetical protein [Sandaracinaceae bacterium]